LADGGAGWQALQDGAPRCLGGAHFIHRLATATERLRRSATGDDVVDEAEARIAVRLLQRWVEVHAFLARTRAQSALLARVIGRLEPSDGDIPPPMASVLATSLRGWDLLLSPRFALALHEVPASVWATPDYRGLSDPPEGLENQQVGLPVTMMQALDAQLDLLRRRVEATRFAPTPQTVASLEMQAGELFRRATLIRALAVDIAARAESESAPSWLYLFDAAASAVDRGQARVASAIDLLVRGVNPLGVGDEDLPLYFFSDTEGPGGRFAAVSDFLLGSTPASTSNWVPKLIADADDALEDTRVAWVALKDREVQRARDQAQLEDDLADVRQTFGDAISNYCGAPSGLATQEILDGWEAAAGRSFSANNCYVIRDDDARPDCEPLALDLEAALDLDDVRFELCVTERLLDVIGADPVLTATAVARQAFEACVEGGGTDSVEECEDGGPFTVTRVCRYCFDGENRYSVPAQAGFWGAQFAGVSVSAREAAETVCAAQYPGSQPDVPRADTLGQGVGSSECFRGTLGEGALTLLALAKDIEIARSEFTDLQDAYDIAMNGCLITQLGNTRIEEAQDEHNENMELLRTAKLVADIAATTAGGIKECAANAAGDGKDTAAIACTAGAAETIAKLASTAFAFAMEQAVANHERLLLSIENDIEEELCFNDAELHLVGARSAALRIERAMIDLEAAAVAFETQKSNAQAAYEDGRYILAAKRDRFVTPMDLDFWIDEVLRRYDERFRFARQVTYLAVRAVEYEYQQSRSERAAVLAAEVPADLENVLRDLQADAGTRGIGGNLPMDRKLVLSLKRHILQLPTTGGGTGAAVGTTLLRRRLRSAENSVWSPDGEYLGQRIPFRLAPLGALELADGAGVGVFAETDCAERLWSVTASIQGAGELYGGDDPSFVLVELEKQNSFFSQWCSSTREGFQVASVRPSRNLFRPEGERATVGGALGVDNGVGSYTTAQIEAVFNATREDLSRDEYAQGDTSQLAARGLYGEYALFFPAGVLADEEPGDSTGLRLSEVEDILLRLDYVAMPR
jgi:hypothetical protein